MQIRIIIEHKILLFSPKTDLQLCKERKEGVFISIFLQIKSETPKFQEPIPD
jgi:hypothetical protein